MKPLYAHYKVEPPPGQIKCDFCSSPVPAYRFFCNDFVCWKTDDYVNSSHGNWAACLVCYDHIIAGEWEKLVEHSYAALLYLHPEINLMSKVSQNEIKRRLRELHQMFNRNMLPTPPELL